MDKEPFEGQIVIGDWYHDLRKNMNVRRKVIDIIEPGDGAGSKRWIYVELGSGVDKRRDHFSEEVFRSNFRPITIQPDREQLCAICDKPVTPEDYWSHSKPNEIVLTHMTCFVDTIIALGRERLQKGGDSCHSQ